MPDGEIRGLKPNSLDKPVGSKGGDKNGTSRHPASDEHRPGPQFPYDWQCQRGDGDLPEFYSKIKRDQGHGNSAAIRTYSELFKGGCEAKTVDQSKGKGQHPAPLRIITAQQVLDANIDDGSRDHWFDKARGQVDKTQRGYRQRD